MDYGVAEVVKLFSEALERVEIQTGWRQCATCRFYKPLEEFGVLKSGRLGRRYSCIPCMRISYLKSTRKYRERVGPGKLNEQRRLAEEARAVKTVSVGSGGSV